MPDGPHSCEKRTENKRTNPQQTNKKDRSRKKTTNNQLTKATSIQAKVESRAKFYTSENLHNVLRWVLGGGVGVPCTVNPLYDGPKAGAEAFKAAEAFKSETKTIRPLGLAVVRRLS